MGFIHSRNVFQKEVITFKNILGRAHTRRCSTHSKRKEDGKIKLSLSKEIPQAMRNMMNSNIEEPLIHISIWIRNYAIMNEEDDEVEGSRRIPPTKQIKISIQLSFHDIVLLCICLYSVITHDRMFALTIVYY